MLKINKDVVLFRSTATLNFLLPALFFAYEYLLRVLPSVLFSHYQQHFPASIAELSFVLSLYYYAYALMQIPAGFLVDRFGAKKFILLGLVCCMLGCYGMITANELWVLGLSRILIGLGGAFSFVSCVRLICLWFDHEQFIFLTGLSVVIGTSGAVLAHVVVAPLISYYGLSIALLWLCVLGLTLFLASFVFIKEKSYGRYTLEPCCLTGQYAVLVHNHRLWQLGGYAFLLTASTSSFAALWGTSYLSQVFHFDRVMSADYIALVFLGWIVGAPLFTWIARRYQYYVKKLMIFAGLGACIMLTTLLFFGVQVKLLLVELLFLLGFFSSGVVLSYTAVRTIVSANYAATASGFVNFCAMSAAIFTQPLIGFLLQSRLTLSSALMILPLFQCVSVILVSGMKLHKEKAVLK